MFSDKIKYINLWILFVSLIFFLLRWYNPIINFDEKIYITILFAGIGNGFIYFVIFKAFANLDLNNSFDPDLIILNKSNDVLSKSYVGPKIYCKKFYGKYYIFYHKLHLDLECIN